MTDPQLEIRNPKSEIRNLPSHLAIIMDGNGRWARARDLPRLKGHKAGAEALRPIVIECANLKLDALTVYSFSTENWARSDEEVMGLMSLYVQYLVSERPLFMDNNVRFKHIGNRDGLPAEVLEQLDALAELTAGHTGMTFVLALNYGSREEIARAARSIAEQVKAGTLDPADITPDTVAAHLDTADLPDPDLLIRTSGELRLSNYLLWQLSYAEFYITDLHWPGFTVDELHKAFAAFAGRQRRFGAVVS